MVEKQSFPESRAVAPETPEDFPSWLKEAFKRELADWDNIPETQSAEWTKARAIKMMRRSFEAGRQSILKEIKGIRDILHLIVPHEEASNAVKREVEEKCDLLLRELKK